MKTIVVAQRKGGAGKTTIAAHIAVAAEANGHGPVYLLDLDAMQGLTLWWKARAAGKPILAQLQGTIAATLPRLQRLGARLIIIDTPPAADAAMGQAFSAADLILVPVQPTPDDLRAIGVTLDMATVFDRPALIVLNRVRVRTRAPGQAREALEPRGEVAAAMLSDRLAYAFAKVDGRTAQELEPTGAAALEVAALWQTVATKLEQPA